MAHNESVLKKSDLRHFSRRLGERLPKPPARLCMRFFASINIKCQGKWRNGKLASPLGRKKLVDAQIWVHFSSGRLIKSCIPKGQRFYPARHRIRDCRENRERRTSSWLILGFEADFLHSVSIPPFNQPYGLGCWSVYSRWHWTSFIRDIETLRLNCADSHREDCIYFSIVHSFFSLATSLNISAVYFILTCTLYSRAIS